ncbi:hypothetical protein [Actinacidiphila acididurans]|uniref:Uncharacterized protein n=1 Tax=Actinacidiphila acididurans TaxID=2784346 RepID=A0ABS2TXC4_9ACTN|nr:hypothetical protein [Actinacidiphila acididurans]MBM9507993.1 hypothetical protein [Actinacidiphila acididurans]
MDILLAVPTPVLTSIGLVLASACAGFILCHGLALLLPQDSADRRELALRKIELADRRRRSWRMANYSEEEAARPRPSASPVPTDQNLG